MTRTPIIGLVVLAATAGGCWKKSSTGPGAIPPEKAAESAHVVSPRAQIDTGFPVDTSLRAQVGTLRLSADGRRVAAANQHVHLGTDLVQVWDVAGQPTKVHESEGRLLALSPDGKRYLRSSKTVWAEVVEVDTGKVLGRLEDRPLENPDHIYFTSADVIVGLRQSGGLAKAAPLLARRYAATTGKQIDESVASDDDRVSISCPIERGRRIALAVVMAGKIRVWDLEENAVARDVTLVPPSDADLWSGFTVSADGTRIAAQRGGGKVEIFDGTSGALVNKVVGESDTYVQPSDGFLSPDGTRYFVRSNISRPDKSMIPVDVVAYDTVAGKFTTAFRGHQKYISMLAASADGKVMATGDEAGKVMIWDLTQTK